MIANEPLPDLFTADVTSEQALAHVRALRHRASDFVIRYSTRDEPRPTEGRLETLEEALASGSLLRAVIRMQEPSSSVTDSLLRTGTGYRIVRMSTTRSPEPRHLQT